jgi:hypothetical protein
MKQIENSLESHKIYLEMFDLCPLISYAADIDTVFDLFMCTPQLWLIDVGYSCDLPTLDVIYEILSEGL